MSRTLEAIRERIRAKQGLVPPEPVKDVKPKKAKKEKPVAEVEAVEDGGEAEATVQAEGQEVAE